MPSGHNQNKLDVKHGLNWVFNGIYLVKLFVIPSQLGAQSESNALWQSEDIQDPYPRSAAQRNHISTDKCPILSFWSYANYTFYMLQIK